MSESHFHSPAALASLLDLCERIAAQAPDLEVVALYEFPRPFVKVKDATNGLVVALSSPAELSLYLDVLHSPQGDATMPRKQSTPKVQSANSVCRVMGHDWMSTAAADWRTCKRERCRASERLVEGLWVSNAAFYRRHVPVETEGTRAYLRSRQRRLWQEEGEAR